MVLVSQIKPGALRLEGDVVVLRAGAYQEFLQGGEVVRQARRQAQEQAAQGRRAAEAARRAGYHRGLQEAQKERARRSVSFVRDALRAVQALESSLVDILSEALFKVVGEMDTQALTCRVVRRALRQYRSLPEVRVRVCPAQESMLRDQIDEWVRQGAAAQFIRVEADPRLKPGDCILESPLGVVNVSLEHQLTALAHAFTLPLGGGGKT